MTPTNDRLAPTFQRLLELRADGFPFHCSFLVTRMIDAEQIYEKARHLDAPRLQVLSEFLDFLLSKRGNGSNDGVFPRTTLEEPDARSVYHGKPVTLEQMRDVIDWEAGRSK